jgi:hypothetical protein
MVHIKRDKADEVIFRNMPTVKITRYYDYKNDPYYWWVVYSSDWQNVSLKDEGSADDLEELYSKIGAAVGKQLRAGPEGMPIHG